MSKTGVSLDNPAERQKGSTRFERLRQRLLNNIGSSSFGNIDSGDLAHELKDISPQEIASLQKEFKEHPEIGELIADGLAKRQMYAEAGEYNPLSLLNDLNSNLSDMASQDRDENMLMSAARLIPGALHGVTEGIQTGLGFGADRVLDEGINSGGALQQAGDAIGLAGVGKGAQAALKPVAGAAGNMLKNQFPTASKFINKGIDAVKGFGKSGKADDAASGMARGGKDGVAKHSIDGIDDVAKAAPTPMPKPGQLALPGPAGTVAKEGAEKVVKEGAEEVAEEAVEGAAKKGLAGKTADFIKANPKKSIAGGLLGGAGIAAAMDGETPENPNKPFEQKPEQNLDNPEGSAPIDANGNPVDMSPAGIARTIQNSLPENVALGSGGATKKNRAHMNAKANADHLLGLQQKADLAAAKQDNFLRERYDATGGRRAGAWDRLSEAQKDLAARNYGQNSFYDSNPNAGGGTGVSDLARADLGMPSMEEQRLADLDAAVEQQRMSNMGYGVASDAYGGPLKTMSKDEFSDKSGMKAEGTGLVHNPDGTKTTLEFGDAFEKAGGMKSAEDFLSNPIEGGASIMANLQNFGPGSGQAPVETNPGQFTPETTTTTMTDPGTNPFTRQNIDEPSINRPRQFETNTTPASFEAPEYQGSGRGMYTDQFGQQSALGEGTVRMSANDEEYGDANFKNEKDALGYLNRGASLDEPAPAPQDPNAIMGPENTADTGLDTLAGLGLGGAAAYLLSKKLKVPKGVVDDFLEATPMPRPGKMPKPPGLPHDPVRGLKKYDPKSLPNRAPGLPHRAPGLPHRADPNKSMSAPGGERPRLVPPGMTREQFRRAQTGMGPSERAAARAPTRDLRYDREPPPGPKTSQLNRKAQLEREARARRLAGQPMNPNPYGVPGNQIHMNGQLPAKRPPFPH